MRKLIIAATFLAGIPFAAGATQIIDFGQTSGTNTVTATANGGLTATTITISDATVLIDQILGIATPPAISAFLDLTAMSSDSAVPVGGTGILQHYNGSFTITSGAGDTGTNYLSGTFQDAAFGVAGGDQMSINIASPPDVLTLSSSIIPANELVPPSSFTFSMSNLTPPLQISGSTIGSFTSSFSGTGDASTAVPEPASLLLLGVGLLGLAWVKRRYSA